MAVSIRLTRGGAKKKPFYRVIVSDSRNRRDGRVLDIVGFFNPKNREDSITLKMDKIKAWVEKGGQLSPAVKKLIKDKGYSV
ncbi:MAG TPA: 30S ribosomal protein S16 [Deltaproteobacteria bacterium]|nr:30S ribosomal protein S16 [Deltaproteobacteria bacterium]